MKRKKSDASPSTLPQAKPQYNYFDMRARDQARIILCASGVEFEDIRPAFNDWPNLKTKFIENGVAYNASLPIYEDPEVGQISESASIIRYLARKHKLDGATEREKVCVDIILQQLIDLREAILPYFMVQGAGGGKGKGNDRDRWVQENVPGIINQFDKFLRRNDGGTGYFVGEGLTVADLIVYDLIYGALRSFDRNVLAKFPLLEAHRQKMNQLPGIQKYIETRPKVFLPPHLPYFSYGTTEEECVQD